MKSWITIGMGLLAGYAHAATPAVPVNETKCKADIVQQRFCAETQSATFPLNIRFFAVASVADYPTVDSLLNKYLKFDQWEAYASSEDARAKFIKMRKSVLMEEFQADDGGMTARHYYDYYLKGPFGIPEKVRGVTLNHHLFAPYEGAAGTIEFEALVGKDIVVPAGEAKGTEGVQLQTGSINAILCTQTSTLCTDGEWLLVYDSTITPTKTISTAIAANMIENGLRTILVGMLYNDIEETE